MGAPTQQQVRSMGKTLVANLEEGCKARGSPTVLVGANDRRAFGVVLCFFSFYFVFPPKYPSFFLVALEMLPKQNSRGWCFLFYFFSRHVKLYPLPSHSWW